MFSIKQSGKEKFTARFITYSLIALGVFFITYFILLPLILPQPSTSPANDLFYLNQDSVFSDPLLTQVPQLDQMITGPIITKADPTQGLDTMPVSLIIYTNFACADCGKIVKVAQQIQTEYPSKVRLIHKDFPSHQINSADYQAAIAGRCAQEQNKFWEMSNLLYQNQSSLENKTFLKLAREIKLDLRIFNSCLNDDSLSSVANLVDDNILEANALQLSGVPTVYLNDEKLTIEVNYESLKKLLINNNVKLD